MNDRPLNVLLVEDNPGDARLIREMLVEAGAFRLEHVARLRDATARLSSTGGRPSAPPEGDHPQSPRAPDDPTGEEGRPVADVVLLDLSLPDASGLDTVRRTLEAARGVPLVVLTGHIDEDQARRAVQEGAQDYLVKGQVTADLLRRSLRYAVERGRVEAELRRRADALAEADRKKDRFLAILSHELRAPLAPLLAAAEVMRATGPLPDDRLEWAREMIARQVRHMAGLLEDLLDLSRITMGKIRIRKQPVALEALIERAVEMSRGAIESHGQAFSVSLPSEPVWLEADPDRIEQVLVNLLRNASAYTDPGGDIRLTAERADGFVVLRLMDDGIGMDEETLGRIFEPFAQGPGSAERSEGGLGVGLSLVRMLVELHGGSIEARSEGPGKGSEFEIRLPCLPAAPAGSPPGAGREATEREPSEDTAAYSVLVVDDNSDAAEGLRLLLSAWGCEVRVAHDGHQALRIARSSPPDLMLLDIGLPGMDGYAVAKALREDRRTADVRIVAVSGYGQVGDRERASEAGFDGYLVKPARPGQVRKLLGARADDRGTEGRPASPESSGSEQTGRRSTANSAPDVPSGSS